MSSSTYHRRTPPPAYDPGWLNAEFAAIERNVGTYLALTGGTVVGSIYATGTITSGAALAGPGTVAAAGALRFAQGTGINWRNTAGTADISGLFSSADVLHVGNGAAGLSFDAAKPTVTGSRGGNAALASLIAALSTLGLITDSSTT